MDFRYYDIPSDRRLLVLESVIRLHGEQAEPVSSAAVARDLAHRWSSATVRKVFTELEELGWVSQPHAAAGRVPTSRGYRVFVEDIVRPSRHRVSFEERLRHDLALDAAPLSAVLERAAGLLSQLSHALGLSLLVFAPGKADGDARVQITGVDQLLGQPEFEDPGRLKVLVHLLDDATPIRSYMQDLAESPGEVRLRIGAENTLEGLEAFSIVTTRIDGRDEAALMGVLGPVRMEYPLILGAMESLVRLLHAGPSEPEFWS